MKSKSPPKKKVLLVCHESLVPPEKIRVLKRERAKTPWITEHDVLKSLRRLNYEVLCLGVYDSVVALEKTIESFKPDIIFNLLEEFYGSTDNEHNICGLFELLNIPHTGASSKNLLLCRDKALTKIILIANNIPTPNYLKLSGSEMLPETIELNFPVIVKSLRLEASTGLSNSSVVYSRASLEKRIIWFKEKYDCDLICEEFIKGKDVTVGAIVNGTDVTIFAPWEIEFSNSKQPNLEVYGQREKWGEKTRLNKGIKTGPYEASKGLLKHLDTLVRETIKALELSGYIRIDFRVSTDEQPFVLEVNPNPNLAVDDEFAESAKFHGFDYDTLIEALAGEKSLKSGKYRIVS